MNIIDTSACNLQMKEKYIKMFLAKNFYHRANVTKDKLIARLEILFNETGPRVKWFLDELLDPQGRGLFGEQTRIKIKGDKVSLEPSRMMQTGGPEDAPIELDRDVLIRLTTKWQELVQKGVPEIFIYQKDGEYFVADTLPEDVK